MTSCRGFLPLWLYGGRVLAVEAAATWSLRNIGDAAIRHVPDTGGTADNVPGTGSLAVVTGFESGECVGSVRRS